jgi:branched-chain amino acid transport system permease protein
MLLGQGGMLSFGHAAYSGLGGFVAIHALNRLTQGAWPLPVSLVPLVGGLAGMGFAVLFGYVTTRKSGTTFAMITLGLAELVFAMSLMIPEFFGGEGGVSGNRVVGRAVLGISFGPAIQVYYLIAAYTLVSVLLMYAFTQTPLGRMLNAVRDNPERVEFIGYNPQRVRYTAFIIAGFFAGISGGLGALTFEIVTAEVVGAARSGAYLLFTFLGGATFFFGPILGAVLMVLAFVLLSEITKAWLLYLGLLFLLMVMFAPGGLASLLMMNLQMARWRKLGRLLPAYAALLGAGSVVLVVAFALIEMVYHRQLGGSVGPMLLFLGLQLDTSLPSYWLGAFGLLIAAGLVFRPVLRRFSVQWDAAQHEIEQALQSKGGLP